MSDFLNLVMTNSSFDLNVLQVTVEAVENALEDLVARSAAGFDITHQLDFSQLSLYEDRLQAVLERNTPVAEQSA